MIARWIAPDEAVDGIPHTYLIAGEAFDWLRLAERLITAAGKRIPAEAAERLLARGEAPDATDEDDTGYFIVRQFTVFNVVAQTTGIELPTRTAREHVPTEAELILEYSGAEFRRADRAAYRPSTDEILLPAPEAFLTADAYGILPPIARLTPEQAMYHFLSGYTARVAGTEIGVTEPEATFSTCFGAPFMPRHPSVYGNLLKERIAKGGVKCWLVNTGWSGGKATMEGIKRMPIKATRALLNAALDGSLNDAEFRKDPNFGFEVPVSMPGVDSAILDPRGTWADKADYDATAQKLVGQFIDNFEQFESHVDDGVRQAAPLALEPAA